MPHATIPDKKPSVANALWQSASGGIVVHRVDGGCRWRMTIYFSFMRYNLLNPEARGFAGWQNYQFLWSDPSFFPAIFNTIILIGSVLLITVLAGTMLAVLFEREFFGRNIATLLVIAPFFVMPTVSALVWKNMILHPVYGLLARIFTRLGLTPIDWFGHYPMISLILIVSWEWLPFAFLILFNFRSSHWTTSNAKRQRSSRGPAHGDIYFTSSSRT